MQITYDDIIEHIRRHIADYSADEAGANEIAERVAKDLQDTNWKREVKESQAREKEWWKKEHERRQKRFLNPETRIVQAQCLRAKRAGAAHTLTVDQWIETIEYFNDMCAYCQERRYQALEHVLSIPLGGTTADNCVPACHSCNNKKRNRTLDQLAELFPAKNLKRINQFLAMQKTRM